MTPNTTHDLCSSLHARVLRLRRLLGELLARADQLQDAASRGELMPFPPELLERAREELKEDRR